MVAQETVVFRTRAVLTRLLLVLGVLLSLAAMHAAVDPARLAAFPGQVAVSSVGAHDISAMSAMSAVPDAPAGTSPVVSGQTQVGAAPHLLHSGAMLCLLLLTGIVLALLAKPVRSAGDPPLAHRPGRPFPLVNVASILPPPHTGILRI